MILGIDPGVTGACAVLSSGGATVHDCPTSATGPGGKREVDPEGIADVLRGLGVGASDTVWVEYVHAMPSQGVSSSFAFGRGYGVWLGALAALGVQVRLVRPRVWKAHHGLISQPKDAARQRALDLWPGLADMLGRKRDHGRADALLIAKYGAGR